jgi:hypothetical protein
MAERFYSGREERVVIREGDQLRRLDLRLDLDPDGQTRLRWGRENAKGKRLAVALLADALSDDRTAVSLAEAFTARVVAMLPERWTMSRTRVLSFVDIITRESFNNVSPDEKGSSARPVIQRSVDNQTNSDLNRGER